MKKEYPTIKLNKQSLELLLSPYNTNHRLCSGDPYVCAEIDVNEWYRPSAEAVHLFLKEGDYYSRFTYLDEKIDKLNEKIQELIDRDSPIIKYEMKLPEPR